MAHSQKKTYGTFFSAQTYLFLMRNSRSWLLCPSWYDNRVAFDVCTKERPLLVCCQFVLSSFTYAAIKYAAMYHNNWPVSQFNTLCITTHFNDRVMVDRYNYCLWSIQLAKDSWRFSISFTEVEKLETFRLHCVEMIHYLVVLVGNEQDKARKARNTSFHFGIYTDFSITHSAG